MKRMVSYLAEDRPTQILQDQPIEHGKNAPHFNEGRMCDCHHHHMSPSSPIQISKSPTDDYHLASPNRLKYSLSSRHERKFELNQSNDVKYGVSSSELTFRSTHQHEYKYRSTSKSDAKYRTQSPPLDNNYHVLRSSPQSNISTSPHMNYKNNDIENIEIENFSLRNRCKRLEAIVSQLIESKEKSTIPDVGRESYRMVNQNSPKDVIIPSPYHHDVSDSSKSPSPVYHQVPTDTPFSDIQPRKFSLTGRPKFRSQYHPYSKENSAEDNEDTKSDDTFRASRIYEKSKDKLGLLNADEMEKQNEIFRMNYYHKTLASKSRNYGWQNKLKDNSFKPYQTKPEMSHKKHSIGHERKTYGIPYEDIIDRPIRPVSKGDSSPMYLKQKHYPSSIPSPQSNIKYGAESSKYMPEHKTNHFNSDFYTKLPPKLHIVESQNKSGVTLTWNATSNCDSSLVKSYQLFARELFGYKVGTMKRIGIISASPLPMSCKVEKLKCNIKYKFAVCAVDIYGRFGKMSNFTGKFELKSENNEENKSENRTDGEEDDELRIILT